MLTEMQFKGLRALEIDEQVPFDFAIDASDCEIEDNAIRPRHGYRASAASATYSGSSGLPSSSIKGATKFTYTAPDVSGTHEYGVLNANLVAAYLNDRGDFGAPYPISGGTPGSKPSSICAPLTGKPNTANILTDGQVLTPETTAYGLLYSSTNTAALASAELSVEAKAEQIGAGSSGILDGWAVKGASTILFDVSDRWSRYSDIDVEAGQFAVSGATASATPVSATCKSKLLDYDVAADLLRITHLVELQKTSSSLDQQRIKITVTLTNLTGSTLNDVRYTRYMDANNGFTTPNTAQRWRVNIDPTAFAIRSVVGSQEIGLGVDNTEVGAAMWVRDSSLGDSTLSQQPFTTALNYVLLEAAGAAKTKTAGGTWKPEAGDAILTTIADYTTGGAATSIETDLSIGSAQDFSIFLMSPEYDIAAGDSATFIFYYYLGASLSSGGVHNPQLVGRYRPGTLAVTDARTIAVDGGAVNEVEDPASETATDGTPTSAGTVFGATAAISGAQLGKYFYLASDEQNVSWQRMKPDYTLEAIAGIGKGVKPTSSLSSLSVKQFATNADFPTADAFAVGAGAQALVATDYYNITGADGEGRGYKWAADQDMSGVTWLAVIVSPPTLSDGGGRVVIAVATAAGNFEVIGETYDTPGSASPNVIFCPLLGLTAATRAAVRRIRFVRYGSAASFLVHGVMAIASAPASGSMDYFATFADNTTQVESEATDTVTVTFDSSAVVIPGYHSVRRNYSSYTDEGTGSLNPDTLPANVCFNKSGNIALPSSLEFAGIPTLSGASSPSGTYDKVRLYRVSINGARRVKEQAITAGAAYSITDDAGDAGLGKTSYRAGGTPPPCQAMAAVGGRIICGGNPANPQRVSISSFVPFAQDTDPFPQFPGIATASADGHAFDIASTAAEQVLWIGEGDKAAYIGTNEAMYVMTNLEPFAPIGSGSEPFRIIGKGVLGRRAACWAEDTVYWASHDGIYLAQRASWDELSQSIRRVYREWLAPDDTTVVAYQDRKLIILCGTKFLRKDLSQPPSEGWTRGTIAHTMLHQARWRDPSGTYEQCYLYGSDGYLYRWQPGKTVNDSNRATTDAGTAIPSWSYSTGFLVMPVPARPKSVFLDVTATITASFYKTTSATPVKSKAFGTAGEHEYPYPPDMNGYKMRMGFTGANTAVLKRAMYQMEALDRKGG